MKHLALLRRLVFCGFGWFLAVAAGQGAHAADAERGALVFRRCAACHAVDEPVNRIGPHLLGVVGRTAGTVPGFSYSAALAGSGIVWTEANLDGFLADPRGFIPGTRMVFAGLSDPADRADVIAFLAQIDGPPPDPGPAPEPVEAVAVGAVAPLLERVSARFGAEAGQVRPIVSPAGESAAIAEFCSGVGADAPDLLGIARRIRQPELDGCAANGIAAVTELDLGYEALVLATGREEPQRDVDLPELWLAFSSFAPGARGLVPNPLRQWPEVGPDQPEGALPQVVGLPGARQLTALGELGLSRGCLAFPAVEVAPQRDNACTSPRRLQRIELAESEIPAALDAGTIELALLTLPGFEAGRAALRAFRINGVAPSAAGVRDGSYLLARPLYLYVKRVRAGRQPGLEAYLAALTAEATLGAGGDLAALGLVPLTRPELAATRRAARTLPALALGGPNLLPLAPIAQHSQVWSWASAAEMALRFAGLSPLGGAVTYRCGVVAAHFASCAADCAACLTPVTTARSLVRALDAYQETALAQRLVTAPAIDPAAAPVLNAAALRRIIRNQRSPVLAQVMPRGGRTFYPPGMTGHFALIVGIAGSGPQAVLTVNDPYPYPEARNPYLGTGARTGEPGRYAIRYGGFRQNLGYRQSVVLR
jgi:cytochrome c2/ABC-type phosphate transport system substrate-binding protein